MPDLPDFVDIHCHLLPELDDGADSWDEALAMARMAVQDGFSTMIVTPHQLGNYGDNQGQTIRRQVARFQGLLDAQAVPLDVLPGADVRIEPEMVRKIGTGEVVTLADRRRHILLELPHELYMPLDRLLDELGRAGLVGILSHPERNQGILRQPEVLDALVEAGCLLQVTAGSVVGSFGPRIEDFSERLIQQGYVHFLATDAHGVKARRPLMRRAFDRVVELAGWEAACEMCSDNPWRVVEGKRVAPGRRPTRGGGIVSWFRRRRAS